MSFVSGRLKVLMPGQNEKIIKTLVEMMKAVASHRREIDIDKADLATVYTETSQPSLDDKLKRWTEEPVGQAMRQGIRHFGEIFIPFARRDELDIIINAAADRSPDPDLAHAIMNHMFDGLETKDGFTFTA
ncbi:hypothetical protein [Georhizobium sp. MAB10]|uniref:hypothetical protein n=1 Tax=Georhizobium sp. MAB10 TaxID=3028319 RepID=UPI003855F649